MRFRPSRSDVPVSRGAIHELNIDLERLQSPCDHNPHHTRIKRKWNGKRVFDLGLAQECSPQSAQNIPEIRGTLGNLRATFFIWQSWHSIGGFLCLSKLLLRVEVATGAFPGRRWNDDFSTRPSLRSNSCTHNSRQTTTISSQQPWNDESEAQQSLPKEHEILCRFMAVVVSSAFWNSLGTTTIVFRVCFRAPFLPPFFSHLGAGGPSCPRRSCAR